MTKLLKLENMIEEFQDYLAANSGLGYVVGENFTAENALDYTDLGRLLTSRVLLTIYDDGGELKQSSRLTIQYRNFRFVTKGITPNGAMDRSRDLVKYLWNKKTFDTATYRWWIRTIPRLPNLVARGDNNSFLADFLVSVVVFNRL